MIENNIELLKNQISKLDSERLNFNAWKSSTIVLVERIFGENNQKIEQINNIKYTSGGIAIVGASHFWNNIESCRESGREILEICIIELENFGLPEKNDEKNEGININLTQHQNQTVNLNIILSSIENELTVKQFKEIKAILKSVDDDGEKKGNLINKLREFGTDIVSKILANILTNPQIFNAF